MSHRDVVCKYPIIRESKAMRYGVWNNKGGVGKTFLSFMLATEVARKRGIPVIVADLCPQANLSEIVLGGNSNGAHALEKLLSAGDSRLTAGGYFDTRIESPHKMTGNETAYLLEAREFNPNMPENLWLIAGDPSLELQAQVINQISGQTLPEDSWKNVHSWLLDLINACVRKVSVNEDAMVFIDCNPSFSAYTELAMLACERLIVPCSSDGSSARAISNLGALLYGIGGNPAYARVGFYGRAHGFGMPLPTVHSVILNRSTQYNKRASKAFGAMFDAIKDRVKKLRESNASHFISDNLFYEVPDNHSVAIVCSHLRRPLYSITPGKYPVRDENPQVNSEPLDRYKKHLDAFVATL